MQDPKLFPLNLS